jgi:ribonuclease P protein component
MKKYSFQKEERLCSLKQIELLYQEGSSFSFYPFRIVFQAVTEAQDFPAQVVITVPKRKFKRAVDRNLLKRRIRECYRHYKEDHLYPLLKEKGLNIHLMILFTGNEIITSKQIEKKLTLALQRLSDKC